MAALFADAGLEEPISEWRGVDAIPAAQRKRQGRPVDLRDTLIAGIALAHEAQLATRNMRHFSDTTISLINPFAPMA